MISGDDILKLVLAILIGGVIGLERELRHKSAGFRTITLICLGSALITILDSRISASGRIAANIVTGIGFLGAGVILHEEVRIKGLTTAATVWIAAALGIGIGSGAYALALLAGGLVLVVMTLFNLFEDSIGARYDRRQYILTLASDSKKVEELKEQIHSCGLRLISIQRMKREGKLVCTLNSVGTTPNQNRFIDQALNDASIEQIEW